MDPQRFDAVIRAWSSSPTRRAALRVLSGSAMAVLAGRMDPADSAARKKKRKKKKVKLCRDGRTIKVPKRKKRKIKKLRRRGATRGACRACQPACDGQLCGSDDGCGGTCGCGAGAVCQAGLCHACTVTCNGGGTACDNDLKAALTEAAGGTVFVCPGLYVGNFTVGDGALIGAGDGDDPATSTILDANENGQVVTVANGANVALHGLRITGGNSPFSGGGVDSSGTLTMTACTVNNNHAKDKGGGIHSLGGNLTLTDCVVSGNTALEDGGGIMLNSDSLTINGSTITGNEAGGFGGGLNSLGTSVAFDSTSSVTGNRAGINGGGIANGGGTVALNGATVSGNDPNNCVNVPGCVG